MKLLFVHIHLGTGGISKTILDRMNYLVENTDFEIHYLAEIESHKEQLDKLDNKISIHCLHLNEILKKKRPRFPIVDSIILRRRVKIALQKYVDDIKPDIITSLDDRQLRKLIPFLKTNAVKIIEFRNSINRKKLNEGFQKNKTISQKVKQCVSPSKLIYPDDITIQNKYDYAVSLTKEDLKDREALKINQEQIYNTISIEQGIKPFKERENIILAVGRLVEEKNFKDLIEAISLIKNELGSWKIHIYGNGGQEETLRQSIKEYGLENVIFLKGFTFTISEIYNTGKILISTSITESFGRTLLEALVYKTPVISYDCKCGPKEIIADKINGYLIEEYNVQDLSDKILKLISNPKLLNEFSDNTYRDLHKFEEGKIMQEWIEFYKSVAKSK
ncbi:MAG: glycosyltransferase [Aequorivita sp.]